ncbi:MAG: nickel-dependent lactate racemase [Synergistaceae bacterium]|nr:nickel-dependent lactate racemase [Synergistaceae bacterium]
MKLTFKIGEKSQDVNVKDDVVLGILEPNEVTVDLTDEAEVKRALENPIGSPRLKDIIKAGEKIAIITSDVTRPMATWKVMPALLDELYAGGAKKEDITLVFALGSHRKQTDEERHHLAGDRAWNEIKCVDSDPDDCIHLGKTEHGTPLDITRVVAEADRRICLGNIEYHYFAGYSGSSKAIMPGSSTREAIQVNHSMMIDPKACAGNIVDNPLRKDIDEAAAKVGVDFILNVVQTPQKVILKAVAGDMIKAHREGCKFLDKLYKKDIPDRADIVMVSQGGSPKDLNLYQTQKALDNAKHAVKKGGIVILIGSCREGLGEKTFEEWITTAPNPHSLIERIHKEFKLGGHKAAAIAMVLENAEIYLVSELEDDFVRKIFMKPFKTVQEAYDAAIKKLGADATVLAMPYGGSTLPHSVKE